MEMKVFSDNNNYIFECMRCGCTVFKLLPEGYTGCAQCNKKYSWVSLFNNWVPHTMSPEEYLIKVMNKEWDPVKQAFVDRDKMTEKDKLNVDKNKVDIDKDKLNKEIKKPETPLKKKKKGKSDEDEI
jgi:hypothetical protein